jgi:hypothetical protein
MLIVTKSVRVLLIVTKSVCVCVMLIVTKSVCGMGARVPREGQQGAFRVEASGMGLIKTRHKPKPCTKKYKSVQTVAAAGSHLVIYRARRLEHLLAKPVRRRRVNCRAVHKYVVGDLREPAYLVHDPRGQKAEVACR